VGCEDHDASSARPSSRREEGKEGWVSATSNSDGSAVKVEEAEMEGRRIWLVS